MSASLASVRNPLSTLTMGAGVVIAIVGFFVDFLLGAGVYGGLIGLIGVLTIVFGAASWVLFFLLVKRDSWG